MKHQRHPLLTYWLWCLSLCLSQASINSSRCCSIMRRFARAPKVHRLISPGHRPGNSANQHAFALNGQHSPFALSGRDVRVGAGVPGRRFALPWADESWRLWRETRHAPLGPVPGHELTDRHRQPMLATARRCRSNRAVLLRKLTENLFSALWSAGFGTPE